VRGKRDRELLAHSGRNGGRGPNDRVLLFNDRGRGGSVQELLNICLKGKKKKEERKNGRKAKKRTPCHKKRRDGDIIYSAPFHLGHDDGNRHFHEV